jgi:sugar lactone lactonase YvrE
VRRALAAALLALAVLPAAASARDRFATSVFALTPRPGFPAMAYVGPDGRVYEGTYTNPTGDKVPSRVFEYSGAGTLLRSWTIRGQNLSGDHGVQVGTMGPSGRLLLLDKSPPRVIRLDRRTGAQKDYARFPDGAVPNYSAWGPDGSLYVTDYEGATIWRVPPRGGTPTVWLKDPGLDGGPFGLTGIRLAADRHTLVVAMQSQAGLGAGIPTNGRIVTIPILAGGKPGPITQLWESRPLDGPDGFGIAKSGAIYIALLLSDQLAVVGPDGKETARARSPLFDSPSSVSFLGTRLMVANQSFVTGTAANQAILDVEAGEPGLPEFIPPKPKPKPKPKRKKRKR